MTIQALEEAKKCDKLYAEFYTAKLFGTSVEKLEERLGKITVLEREKVEDGAWMVEEAKEQKIGFLVVGDCMTATTHVDLKLDAEKAGVDVKVVFGTSIYTAAAGVSGLQIYKFGRSTSITFPDEKFKVRSHYDVIKQNKKQGLHTLCLLDIKPPKFMTANEAMEVLLDVESEFKEKVFTEDTKIIVVARAGSEEPLVKYGKVKELVKEDFDGALHTIIVPGKLHFKEEEALNK